MQDFADFPAFSRIILHSFLHFDAVRGTKLKLLARRRQSSNLYSQTFMIIIRTRYFPFGSFYAINLFGIIFAKGGLDATTRRHEFIHTLQQREMLFILFYVWYVTEWFVKFIYYRNLRRAYHAISFEREAYEHDWDKEYINRRLHFAWIKSMIK